MTTSPISIRSSIYIIKSFPLSVSAAPSPRLRHFIPSALLGSWLSTHGQNKEYETHSLHISSLNSRVDLLFKNATSTDNKSERGQQNQSTQSRRGGGGGGFQGSMSQERGEALRGGSEGRRGEGVGELEVNRLGGCSMKVDRVSQLLVR